MLIIKANKKYETYLMKHLMEEHPKTRGKIKRKRWIMMMVKKTAKIKIEYLYGFKEPMFKRYVVYTNKYMVGSFIKKKDAIRSAKIYRRGLFSTI